MTLRLKKTVLLLLVLLAAGTLSATKRKVLFIGNSYTYTNNMPLMLQTLATAMGDTLIYDESDPGGYRLEDHFSYAPTIAKIFSQPWDVVVLQEQSQLPAFPPAEVDTEVYPYAHALDSVIHVNDTCTQTMFLMTWGHANGDPMNCGTYPVICTYDGMQQRLRESYLHMTQVNNAVVAPVGAAWKVEHDSFPALWLYIADSSHPLVAGSYLEACVLYNSIFHKRVFSCTYTSGLTTSDALTLQRIADKVTMDSLAQWQQYGHYPYAGFDHTLAGTAVSLAPKSPIPVHYSWDYGDGNSDTVSVPVHIYSANGTYTVAHTAYNDCFTETLSEVLHVGTTGTAAVRSDKYPVNLVQNGNGNITFIMPPGVYDVLEVSDSRARVVKRYNVTAASITDNFVPGFYVAHASSSDRKNSCYSKLVIY